jgi:4,5-DOPA dioxygenase extradiol
VPLLLSFPAADIPVLQLSVQTREGPQHAFALGRALAPLRKEGVLIMGSGSFTHDLRRFRGQPVDEPETPDVTQFSAWMDEAIARSEIESLLEYRERAPFARAEHPTEEHILPLFTMIGAGANGRSRRLHHSTEYGILRMDAYAFGLTA